MDKRIPSADIRRVWLDPSLTTAAAARVVGLTRTNLWVRAKALGLPPRKKGRPHVIPPDQLRLLWAANVRVADIAERYGCPFGSVRQAAKLLGLPARPMGKHATITLQQYRDQLLGRAMARAARRDQFPVAERARAADEAEKRA
jgi:hypothetical protein